MLKPFFFNLEQIHNRILKMYCNSESVNKPSHPSPPAPQFDKIWHVHYLTHMPSALCILKCSFFIIAGQTIKIQVYLKNSNERKKSFSANISHTQQFTKCTQQFHMDLLYSKQPCPHYHRQ